MKKILLSLVAIVLFTMNMSAQKEFAGIVKSKVYVEDENIDPSIRAQYPIALELKVLNNKTRTDMNQQGAGMTQIQDGENNKNYFVVDLTAFNMAVYYTELPTSNEKAKFDYQYDKNDRKTVAGFDCYKVTCTVTDLETDEMQDIIFYISDDFLPNFKSMTYIGLTGFPLYTKMEIKTEDFQYFQIEEVETIEASKKIKVTNFLLPSNAVEMTDEVKAMLGMKNGGE